ncbi:MAG: M20/M25/M40 family metallo-hydrolase [Sulfolobales archaeon]|nr:M20/M25/M40 family metallo-hydrolase [Sulfolobales archaeon]MDW8083419.1 M20/M25/M40 family metallo-hydrolase [Sulfolobales archaeon]
MANKSELINLLDTLVSFNTVNDPERGIKPTREIVDFLIDWLAKRGIAAEVVESSGYYSVFGFIGREPPCVGLLSHFDTVPAILERWSYDPFKLTVVGSRAYGRGALDDKSNVASILIALEELVKSRPSCGIAFAFTGDEEIGGSNGAYIVSQKLKNSGLLPRYIINGDGAGMMPIVRRRKSFSIEVYVKSRKTSVRGFIKTARFTAHYPVSQHAHAAYFIGGVDSHPLISASVFTRENDVLIRSIRGSFVKSNVIPPEVEVEYVVPDSGGSEVEVDEGLTELVRTLVPLAKIPIRTRAYSDYGVSITPNIYTYSENIHKVVLDVRAMSLVEDITDSFREVIKACLPSADIKVRTDLGHYLYTPPNSKVVEVLTASLRDVGIIPRLTEGAGASDSRYFTSLGVEVVDIGPRGGGMHGDNEYVDIDSLSLMPIVYYKTVKSLTQQKHQ